MGTGISRSIDRMLAKATYDPELEKQLANEKQQARIAREKFRSSLLEAQQKNKKMVQDQKLTPTGNTLAEALFKETNEWLTKNPNATSDELGDKAQDVLYKLKDIYLEDSNRVYFNNFLTFWTATLVNWRTTNKVASDKLEKIQELIKEEQKWFEKNNNESAQTYQDKIEQTVQKITTIINDPSLMNTANSQQDKLKDMNNTKEMDELKEKAEQAKRDKEALEKQQFSAKRVVTKFISGAIISFFLVLFLVFGLVGGSLASNDAIARPIPYRILYFLFGFFFSVPTILYFIGRSWMGKPPYFASYLLPLYPFDLTLPDEQRGFFQTLFYYDENAIVQKAKQDFLEMARKNILG